MDHLLDHGPGDGALRASMGLGFIEMIAAHAVPAPWRG